MVPHHPDAPGGYANVERVIRRRVPSEEVGLLEGDPVDEEPSIGVADLREPGVIPSSTAW